MTETTIPDLRQKGGKVSRRKLEAFCREQDIPLPMYEAYGKKVCAYWFNLKERAPEVQHKLVCAGLKISDDYYGGDITKGLEAENISYFRAWHWDV
jgi:hypothetical protein